MTKKQLAFINYKSSINFYSRYYIMRYNEKLFAIFSKGGTFSNLYAVDGNALAYRDGYITHSEKTLFHAFDFLKKIGLAEAAR